MCGMKKYFTFSEFPYVCNCNSYQNYSVQFLHIKLYPLAELNWLDFYIFIKYNKSDLYYGLNTTFIFHSKKRSIHFKNSGKKCCEMFVTFDTED